jgi:hypothetical protein
MKDEHGHFYSRDTDIGIGRIADLCDPLRGDLDGVEASLHVW